MRNQSKRKTGKEQYYTPLSTASECVAIVRSLLSASPELWLEPAGGTGSFITALLRSGTEDREILSYDIEPLHPLVTPTENFLEENVDAVVNSRSTVAIGNPPFGRNHSLSVRFFNKAADFSTHIAFIVPVSWRKWSVLDRLDKRFHLIWDNDLQVEYEYLQSGSQSKSVLRTCFQVYERRDKLRSKVLVEDRGYVAKTTQDRADISLTVFGVYGRRCGEVFDNPYAVPPATQIFLELREPWVRAALDKIDYGRFASNSALAISESLSYRELLFLLNEWKDKHDCAGGQL